MHVSKVLMSMKDASIYMRMSTDMITPDGGKAKARLRATAHATIGQTLPSGFSTTRPHRSKGLAWWIPNCRMGLDQRSNRSTWLMESLLSLL